MLTLTAAIVVIGALIFTLAVRAKDIPPPEPESPTRHLEERKATIYENLRDLQFEYRVGKLSDADYQATKTDLQRELAAVLAEIDKLAGTSPPPPAPKPERIECASCGAHFDKPMKFCGECGAAMTVEAR
jgi:hypothetical protein